MKNIHKINKNIHVLPTENESRIRYNSFNKVYELCEFPKYHTDIKSAHNIYITSDEEIEDGDWVYFISTNEVIKVPLGGFKGKVCKKIILTTDQYLIKDGIQAIDDEFLEWLVKNASCERVETEIVEFGFDEVPICIYKIIIPKEEDFKHELRVLSKEEVLANRSSAYEFIDFDKKETIEEAAERYFPFAEKIGGETYTAYRGFMEGAKWQAEKMYNEKNINHFEWIYNRMVNIHNENINYDYMVKFKSIIEQFKNKSK